MKRVARIKVGDRVSGYTLISPVAGGKGVSWKAQCDCGVVHHINGYQPPLCCVDCSNKKRIKPHKCRSCGTEDKKDFRSRKHGGKTECMSCARAACRNGRTPDGKAIRKRPKRKTP